MSSGQFFVATYFIANAAYHCVLHKLANCSADKHLSLSVSSILTALVLGPIVLLIPSHWGYLEGLCRSPRTLVLCVLLLGVLSSVFLAATMCRLRTIQLLPSPVAYFLARLSLPLTVLLSAFIFKERLAGRQILAVAIGLALLLFGSLDKGSARNFPQLGLGVLWGVLGAMLTAVSQLGTTAVVSNRLSLQAPPLAYVFGINITTLLCGALGNVRRPLHLESLAPSLRRGLLLGCCNTITFCSLACALKTEFASIVYTVGGLSVLFPALLFAAPDKVSPGLATIYLLGIAVVVFLVQK